MNFSQQSARSPSPEKATATDLVPLGKHDVGEGEDIVSPLGAARNRELFLPPFDPRITFTFSR